MPMERYKVGVVHKDVDDIVEFLIPMHHDKTVSALIEATSQRLAKRARLILGQHALVLRLWRKDGPLIDENDTLQDVIQDPQSDAIFIITTEQTTSVLSNRRSESLQSEMSLSVVTAPSVISADHSLVNTGANDLNETMGVTNGDVTASGHELEKLAGMGDDPSQVTKVGEDWEIEDGVVHAHIMSWHSATEVFEENKTKTQGKFFVHFQLFPFIMIISFSHNIEIAYAGGAITTHDVSGESFRFTRVITLPFFGAGIIDFPPGSFKRSRNSGKTHLVFFLHNGKVTVEVGTPSTRFSIREGGQWQIPRGNFYSITNPGDTLAQIFFAQGSEIFAKTIEDPDLERRTRYHEIIMKNAIKG